MYSRRFQAQITGSLTIPTNFRSRLVEVCTGPTSCFLDEGFWCRWSRRKKQEQPWWWWALSSERWVRKRSEKWDLWWHCDHWSDNLVLEGWRQEGADDLQWEEIVRRGEQQQCLSKPKSFTWSSWQEAVIRNAVCDNKRDHISTITQRPHHPHHRLEDLGHHHDLRQGKDKSDK